jgi:hypothetical protein
MDVNLVSIDHGDLHAKNFGVRENGIPFFIDWSNASISLPITSIEFLVRVANNTLGLSAGN